MHRPDAETALRRDLDRCVKCGLCLPECPTYRLASDESESPRGRLALFEGLLDGHVGADSGALRRHIDSCLTCRRCERVCPSQVPYGRLIDAARERLPADGAQRLLGLLQRPRLQQLATAAARAMPLGVSRPLGRLHRMHRVATALPRHGRPPAAGWHKASTDPARGRVGLFAGCTGAAFQPAALHAAVLLTRRAGFDVFVPARASCCGALSAHAGDRATADRLATETRALFTPELDAVVSIASGCGIHLDAYEPPALPGHRDVCRFLVEHGELAARDFEPLDARVALHVPCSVENVYHGADWARSLLQLVPGIRLQTIGETGQCCGAAGDHMLRDPLRAARLREPILNELKTLASGPGAATILVSSNVGCALHLADGLQGQPVGVMHPVELLAQQLKNA